MSQTHLSSLSSPLVPSPPYPRWYSPSCMDAVIAFGCCVDIHGLLLSDQFAGHRSPDVMGRVGPAGEREPSGRPVRGRWGGEHDPARRHDDDGETEWTGGGVMLVGRSGDGRGGGEETKGRRRKLLQNHHHHRPRRRRHTLRTYPRTSSVHTAYVLVMLGFVSIAPHFSPTPIRSLPPGSFPLL